MPQRGNGAGRSSGDHHPGAAGREKTQTVSFYEAEGRKVYIEVDGVCAFMCRRSFVDTLFKNMDLYDTDQDFILNW